MMYSSKSSKVSVKSRDELLERARQEREGRQKEKTRKLSAIIVQVIIVPVDKWAAFTLSIESHEELDWKEDST